MTKLEKLQQWLLYTPVGRHVLRNERIFYHNSVHNIFGYYSLQIGLREINFLQGNKIPNHYVLDHDIKCDLHFLPFASNSIDLIVCPHSLELSRNYHHILSECQRVLIPNGKLIITSFNRNCIFKYFGKKQAMTNGIDLISLDVLTTQLRELNFSIDGGKFFGYRPPINNAKALSRLAWLDKVGNRWFPTYANNYGLIARKDVVTPTFIPQKKPNFTPEFEAKLGTAKICKHN